jgi:hypothetical protein
MQVLAALNCSLVGQRGCEVFRVSGGRCRFGRPFCVGREVCSPSIVSDDDSAVMDLPGPQPANGLLALPISSSSP